MQAPSLPPEFRGQPVREQAPLPVPLQPKSEFSKQLRELEATLYSAIERFQNESHAEVISISTQCDETATIDSTLLLRKKLVITTQAEGVWFRPPAPHATSE